MLVIYTSDVTGLQSTTQATLGISFEFVVILFELRVVTGVRFRAGFRDAGAGVVYRFVEGVSPG